MTITDDLDGSGNATEVAFSLNGVDYTIDLGKKNRMAMGKALKPYVEAATKVSRNGTPRRRKPAVASTGKGNQSKIREWARDNGVNVSDRGRIPASVIEQYEAAR